MRVRLLTSEAWRSLGANISTTVASAVTVLIAMFLLGLFISFFTLARSWSDHVKSEIVVKVYFKNHATTQQKNTLARNLEQNPYVKRGRTGSSTSRRPRRSRRSASSTRTSSRTSPRTRCPTRSR